MRWLPFVLLGSCIADGTRDFGEGCWEHADCVSPAVCVDDMCVTACEVDAECVFPAECHDLWCDPPDPSHAGGGGEIEGGGGDDDGGGGGYITCHDGTRSPNCTTCSQGCCSSHGGCE